MKNCKARIAGLAVCCLAMPTASQAALKISSRPTQNVTCSAGVCSATAKTAILNVSDLAGMLAAGDVSVASGSLAQDIEADHLISWTSSHRLTLDSYRLITVNDPIEVTGSGGLIITTNDQGSGGDLRFLKRGHVKFWDLKSALNINGDSYRLLNDIKQFAHYGRKGGFIALAGSYNANKDGTFAHPLFPEGSGHASLEGLGNTISNLTIDDPTDSNVGVFDDLGSFMFVRDLRLASATIGGSRDSQDIGAFAGQAEGEIRNCSVDGLVTHVGAIGRAGGLVGATGPGLIVGSYSVASIIGGSGDTVGGLVGDNGARLDQSFSTGSVSAGDSSNVGGLVGINRAGSIVDSYETGTVTGGNNAVLGGLAGMNIQVGGAGGIVATSYSTGLITGGAAATTGGLIGADQSSGTIKDSYWDLNTSGVSNPHQGAGNVADDPGITGLTDAQLKSGLPAGFDKKIWKQKPNVNNGYPYLSSNPPR